MAAVSIRHKHHVSTKSNHKRKKEHKAWVVHVSPRGVVSHSAATVIGGSAGAFGMGYIHRKAVSQGYRTPEQNYNILASNINTLALRVARLNRRAKKGSRYVKYRRR